MNNKELESEAKEYAENKSSVDVFKEAHIKDFIAGATSKWVEKQKLEFAIEQLDKCVDIFGNVNFTTLTANRYILKQKLLEL